MRLGIDLDGVVYDFVGTLRSYLLQRDLIPSDLPPVTDWDFPVSQWGMSWEQFDALVDEGVWEGILFAEGKAIPGALIGLDELHNLGHKIHFITHRKLRGKTAASTERWLYTNRVHYDGLSFVYDKYTVDADLYIDDSADVVASYIEHGKPAICFSQPWNVNAVDLPRVYTWTDIVSYVSRTQLW